MSVHKMDCLPQVGLKRPALTTVNSTVLYNLRGQKADGKGWTSPVKIPVVFVTPPGCKYKFTRPTGYYGNSSFIYSGQLVVVLLQYYTVDGVYKRLTGRAITTPVTKVGIGSGRSLGYTVVCLPPGFMERYTAHADATGTVRHLHLAEVAMLLQLTLLNCGNNGLGKQACATSRYK